VSNTTPSTSVAGPSRRRLNSPHVWCFTTYFAEGLPFTVIRSLSSLFLRDRQVSLEAIGLTSLLGLPWALKFLWGPQVDEYGTRRGWMLALQVALAVAIVAAGLCAPMDSGVQIITGLFLVAAVLAATHDMAIDGYYMAALDAAGQTRFLGYRVMAYRIAMMTGTGVVATVSTAYSWSWGFALAGVLLALLAAYHAVFLPRVETAGRPWRQLGRRVARPGPLAVAAVLGLVILGLRALTEAEWLRALKPSVPALRVVTFPNVVSALLLTALVAASLGRRRVRAALGRRDSFYARAFVDFLSRPGIGPVLAFVIFLRTGEFMLSAMVSPFIVDLGLKQHYGWLSSGVGLPCSVAGALAGGFLLERHGMRRMLWPFLLAQNLTNLVYMLLALYLQPWVLQNTGQTAPVFMGMSNLVAVAAVHGFDNFAGGLGTSVLTVYLMRVCSQEFRAAHFAIGSGLMSISGVFAGICSGYVAGTWGYPANFGLSFVLAVPGMVLAWFLPAAGQEKVEDAL
jgi:PAT family beta-lactamase induction signal transducer AmpG